MRTVLLFAAVFFLAAQVLAQPGTTRTRRYVLRDTFAQFDAEKCYDLTRDEGERAFRAGDWETSAALFRAAKNCADADQNKRQIMTNRIAAARQAAIDELEEQRQEAIRVARRAIASNRADDAWGLLQSGDRNISYRLADFANRYISPPGESNADCVRSLLDAWNYVPYIHSNMTNYPDAQVPFCFQVAENLGTRTPQVRYQQRDGRLRLYVFSADKSLLRSWNGETMVEAPSVRLDTTLTGFDVSPDGHTLLFFSDKKFVLWRSSTESFSIEVPARSMYTFSERGDQFYFLDRQKGQIKAISTSNSAFKQQNKYSNRAKSNEPRTELRMFQSVQTDGLLQFAVRGDRLWMLYMDSVKIWADGAMRAFAMPYPLPSNTGAEQVRIWPEQRVISYVNDTLFIQFALPSARNAASEPVEQKGAFRELPLAYDAAARMLVTLELPDVNQGHRLFFKESLKSLKYFSGNPLRPGNSYDRMSGAVSPDGRWCAIASQNGTLEVFALHNDTEETQLPFFRTQSTGLLFSPDGQYFAALQADDTLRIFDAKRDQQLTAARRTWFYSTVLTLSNSWVIHRINNDSVEAFNFKNRRQMRFKCVDPEPGVLLINGTSRYVDEPVHNMEQNNGRSYGLEVKSHIALSPDDRFLAYALDTAVVIQSLDGSLPVAVNRFRYSVRQLRFSPQGDLLIGVYDLGAQGLGSGHGVKLWNVAHPATPPKDLLLPRDLYIQQIGFSPDGQMIALSDGIDARIFRLDNLQEEYSHIYPWEAQSITAMSFFPDGQSLALGYGDGNVVLWDVNTAQKRYVLTRPTSEQMSVQGLHFLENGKKVRQAVTLSREDNGRMVSFATTFFTRELDQNDIYQKLTKGTRQLVSFNVDQIYKYNLESALSYDDNFDRLASSGDLPLIRSFFDFYQAQALSSNNSEQVREYCSQAFALFQKLAPSTREALRSTMLEMYDDLIWKLLLRNKTADAAIAIRLENNHFGKPLDAVKWSAHAALLRNDLKTAANQYADWYIRSQEEKAIFEQEYVYMDLEREFGQLHNYGLLQASQRQLICAVFGEQLEVESLCAESALTDPMALFDPVTRLRWSIFRGLQDVETITNHGEKTRLLGGYLNEAKKLVRQNPAYRSTLENVVLAQATNLTDQGENFENGNDRALRLYAEAVRTLHEHTTFKKSEPQYWDVLSNIYLLTGNAHLAKDNIAEAIQAYEQGVAAASKIPQPSVLADYDEWGFIRSERLQNLFTQIGMAYLLEDKIVEASAMFEQAAAADPEAVLNSLFIAHIALLTGDTDDAFINYGGYITDASQYAHVLFDIERFANRLPAKRTALLEFMARLRQAMRGAKPEIDSVVAQYNYADLNTYHAAALRQWDQAKRWSLEALQSSNQMNDPFEWFRARQSVAYFHLLGNRDTAALSLSIRYTREAEDRVAKGVEYQYASVLKTNLAHALLLRQRPGDRAEAIRQYQAFLEGPNIPDDPWEVLQKDFRDLRDAGVRLPNLRGVIREIKPGLQLTPEEWREIE